MPTKPLEAILYRELSKAEAREVIEVASPLLQELVNYSINALARCATSPSGNLDEDVAVLALYRHLIEMTDGIEVLVSQSCPIPAIPLVRSAFETLLSIEYILENDQEYVRRSLAWLVGYVHKRLEMYERFDSTTPLGKEFERFASEDTSFSKISPPPLAEVQKAKTNLQSMLTKPHIQSIEAEFRRHKRKPYWYKLFGGPSDLPSLARHLKRRGQYEVLYRHWSRTAHAQDLLTFISRTDEGQSAIGRLRNPSQMQEVVSYSASFMLAATRQVLAKFRPGEDLSRWYEREVRKRYLTITGARRKMAR